MNKFIQAVKDLDQDIVEELLQKNPAWAQWENDDGKNALHYLCGINILNDAEKGKVSLKLLKLLLNTGMDINSIHRIKEGCGFFPATPLWYAYTRGRNKKIYTWLLANGANPDNCMFAIAWYDDKEAAALFKKHGAGIEDRADGVTPFVSAFLWKKYQAALWFLENGADVDAADNNGNTSLYYAVKRKLKPEQIDLLLKFGADINKENQEAISPKKLAEQNRQRNILKIFETQNNK